MTATLLWDVTRQPVGPSYRGSPVSGDAIAVTFRGQHVAGQLWERVEEGVSDPWEYGFYDSDPDGTHRYEPDWEPEPPINPTIFWYVFGLPHQSADSARHTGLKSTWGHPVIVRRRHSQAEEANTGRSYQYEPVSREGEDR